MRVLLRVRYLFAILVGCTYVFAQPSSSPLITRPVDESQLAILHGNTHQMARAEFDQGAAPLNLPMNRMLLVLKRSEAQGSALRTLLDDQQDKASPNYHKWLTPETFGREFGASDQDIRQVTLWLQAHGFQVAQVSRGRIFIEFSGTAAQVQETLHTPIHKYTVRNESHWANSSDPQIPAALAPVVAGLWSLHNFFKKPQLVVLDQKISAIYRTGTKPEVTFSNGLHALSPADYGVIYNIGPPPSGNAATIAILGRSNINVSQDVMAFHYITNDGASFPQVIVNGPDPGDLGGGEEAEAVLDTTWSGAVGRNAQVVLVVSASTNTTDGIDLSELYAVDNNLADVMSESFGNCESGFTSAEATAISNLAQQAAAQGITYTVSSGDSGIAGCDDPNAGTPASHAPSVNILASTPYTVAVGGSMFNENGQSSIYWNAINSQGTGESAISYIPEKVWNESCLGTQCGAGGTSIWAGGGGPSALFPKPAWQASFGDTGRDTPDVSLTAAIHDPYLLCLQNSCAPNSQGLISFAAVGGTSASAPAFAGIMALVAEQTGSRQGQANYVLYRLAAAETYSACNGSKPGGLASNCVFNDITLGNNSVPGDADYGSASAKYQTSTGYDNATGLGSVNVTNLLNAWSTATFNATTTTASINPQTAIHGAAMNVNVTVTGHSGTPTGSVRLEGSNQASALLGGSTLSILTLDGSGSVATPSHVLPGGTYQITAHYVGDGVYAPSDSSAIAVTVNPEPSSTNISLLTTDSNGNYIPYASGPYGTPVYMKAHVAGRSGFGIPTSNVTFSSSNQPPYSATLDQNGDAITTQIPGIAPGTYSFVAQYLGDASFNSSSSAHASLVVSKASTTTSLSATPATQGATLTAVLGFGGNGNLPSGTVTFYSGTTSLGSTSVSQSSFSNGSYQASANLFLPQLANGQYSMTAAYSGDTDYIPSASSPLSVALQPDFSFDPITAMTGSVPAGQSASFLANVNFNDGFAGTVSFSCGGLPAKANCTATPLSSPGTATVTIATTAPTTAVALKHSGLSLWFTTLGGGFAAMLLLGIPRKSLYSVASAAAIALLLVAAGCGGGSTSTPVIPPTPQSVPGTPGGTYNVTITATGGTITHSVAFVLTVN